MFTPISLPKSVTKKPNSSTSQEIEFNFGREEISSFHVIGLYNSESK